MQLPVGEFCSPPGRLRTIATEVRESALKSNPSLASPPAVALIPEPTRILKWSLCPSLGAELATEDFSVTIPLISNLPDSAETATQVFPRV